MPSEDAAGPWAMTAKESYTGANWSENVAKQAIAIG
jgi:hypothetical protein